MVEDRLESFLDSYFGKESAARVTARPLGAGWSSAKLYYLKAGGKEYVLRLLDLESSKRCKECHMLEHASRLGVGPRVHHLDSDQGIVLMDHINNAETITLEQAQDSIAALAQALRIAHTIPDCPAPHTDLSDKACGHYMTLSEKGLLNDAMRERMDRLQELLAKRDALCCPSTWIHGDLHIKNIFLQADGKILLIDWEGARYDDPFYDIAYSSTTLNYGEEQTIRYLNAYLGHTATEEELRRYHLCEEITRIAIHFELLEWAYFVNRMQPLGPVEEPRLAWDKYMERFVASSDMPSAEFIYQWAYSVLER